MCARCSEKGCANVRVRGRAHVMWAARRRKCVSVRACVREKESVCVCECQPLCCLQKNIHPKSSEDVLSTPTLKCPNRANISYYLSEISTCICPHVHRRTYKCLNRSSYLERYRCVYIHIYTLIHLCIDIYIYIYIHVYLTLFKYEHAQTHLETSCDVHCLKM